MPIRFDAMALRALFFEDFAMAEKRAADYPNFSKPLSSINTVSTSPTQEEVKKWMETTDNRNIDRKDA